MNALQAKDIADDAFLSAVVAAARSRGHSTATRWDIAAVLAGRPEDVGQAVIDYPEVPAKVVLAKARRLIKRGMVDGCACGCRGSFSVAL